MVFHVTYVSGYMRCLEEFLGVTAVAETTHLFVDKLLSVELFANFFFVISHDESMSPDDKVICVPWQSQFFDGHWVIFFLLRSLQLAILIHSFRAWPLFTFPMRFPWSKSQQAIGVAVGIKNLKCCRAVQGKSLWKEPRIWRVIGDRLVVNEDRLWMLEQAGLLGFVGGFPGVVPMWKNVQSLQGVDSRGVKQKKFLSMCEICRVHIWHSDIEWF